MKIGGIPIVSIILLIFFSITLVVNLFLPASRLAITPYLDGGMMGALLVVGLYYANIYVSAWMNNRKKASVK